ncbi:MAG: hypothetical protein IIA07_06970 [Proteobacteria bacterium]|nr:hypothetical protein [Pseudomonadota bacterium]
MLALVIASAIAMFVLYRALIDSGWGQLRVGARQLKSRYRGADRAQKAVNKAVARLEKLRARSDSVKPKLLTAASDALDDARSLCKIAEDQVLIAETHVRNLIADEYPPKLHEAMRCKFLARPD